MPTCRRIGIGTLPERAGPDPGPIKWALLSTSRLLEKTPRRSLFRLHTPSISRRYDTKQLKITVKILFLSTEKLRRLHTVFFFQMPPSWNKILLLAGLAAWLYAAGVQAQGLFPPLYPSDNFATSNPVTATSTCGECGDGEEEGGGGGCESCNNTCPFGDTLPEPVDLMATGLLQAGVVSA